jgi:acetyl-CoA carboxylase biotin carboxyl carrier protein
VRPGVLVSEGVWAPCAFLDGRGINALAGDDSVAPHRGMAFHDLMVSAGCRRAERERQQIIALSLPGSARYTKTQLLPSKSFPHERNEMKKPSGPQTDESAQSVVDVVAIDRLAKIVAQYDLHEIEISLGDLRVRLARQPGPSAQAILAAVPETAPIAPKPAQGPALAAAAAEPPAADLARAVKSPMVGTAYLRSSPEAKPFVEVGSVVKTGDKLLLVEAMKTFNDIVAPWAGKVVNILVADGAPVEYDQPLMIIE